MDDLAKIVWNYGFGTMAGILLIWGSVDLYLTGKNDLYKTLKEKWVPNFLRSFERIAESSEDTAEEIKKLGAVIESHASRLENIEVKIDQVLVEQPSK